MNSRPAGNPISFDDRLADYAKRLRDQAATMPPGADRDDIERKARQADGASGINNWLSSPELKAPK